MRYTNPRFTLHYITLHYITVIASLACQLGRAADTRFDSVLSLKAAIHMYIENNAGIV